MPWCMNSQQMKKETDEQEEEEAEEEEVAPPFAQLLGPYPVTFLQGRVASVQPEHATQVRAGGVDGRIAADSGAGSAGSLLAAAEADRAHHRCLLLPPLHKLQAAGWRQHRRRRGDAAGRFCCAL